MTNAPRPSASAPASPSYKWDVADFDDCVAAVKKVESRARPGRSAGQQRRHHPRRHMRKMNARPGTRCSIPISAAASICARRSGTACWTAASAASSISARSTARPASTARSTMPPPSRASTASPRRWRRKAPPRASPSTPSRRAISTPKWWRRCRAERAGEDRGAHPGRPAGQGRGDRPRRSLPGGRRRGLHHRLDAVDQRRPAYVLARFFCAVSSSRLRSCTSLVHIARRPAHVAKFLALGYGALQDDLIPPPKISPAARRQGCSTA